MKLIDDWGRVWHRLWSVRLALLSAVLSAAEFAVQYLAPGYASGRFALVALVLSLAAGLARIVAQPKLWERDDA